MISTVIAHCKQSYRFTNVNVKVIFILFAYCNMISTVIDQFVSWCNMISRVLACLRQSYRFFKLLFSLFLYCNMILTQISHFRQSYRFTKGSFPIEKATKLGN